MGSVMVSAICNSCKSIFPEMWVNRDDKGFPVFEGVICSNCGKACLSREWSNQVVNSIILPVEDGQINRFEYSYKDDNGKTHNKKIDPHIVRKHLERGGKK